MSTLPTGTENGTGSAKRFNFSRLKPWLVPIVAVGAALAAMPWLIGPPCPRRVVIAAGSPSGAYTAFAGKYREILARDGIELEVRTTAGSIENTSLLLSEESGVSLAIIQGGTASEESLPRLKSLASLYLEPIWVFYRGGEPDSESLEPDSWEPDSQSPVLWSPVLTRLTELRGRRIAIGPEGSGTRAVALDLLGENDLIVDGKAPDGKEPRNLGKFRGSETTTVPDAKDPRNLGRYRRSQVTTVPLGGEEAAAALKRGDVDVAFFVISPQSPLIRELLQTDGVRLMNFRRADAFHRKHPFLTSVTLSEGILDLPHNTPAEDVVLLAPTANLVARDDLHSSLVPLLLKAATEAHRSGNILSEPGEFPSPKHVEYPLSSNARRYFQSGPSMLYRYLPFRLAARIDQLKLVLLPLCTLLFPLLKAAPPIYRWRIRSRIYRWYRVLREVDQRLKETGPAADLSEDVLRLKQMEAELAEVTVPLSYMEEFYNLRLHAAFVLERLERWQSRRAATSRRAA